MFFKEVDKVIHQKSTCFKVIILRQFIIGSKFDKSWAPWLSQSELLRSQKKCSFWGSRTICGSMVKQKNVSSTGKFELYDNLQKDVPFVRRHIIFLRSFFIIYFLSNSFLFLVWKVISLFSHKHISFLLSKAPFCSE